MRLAEVTIASALKTPRGVERARRFLKLYRDWFDLLQRTNHPSLHSVAQMIVSHKDGGFPPAVEDAIENDVAEACSHAADVLQDAIDYPEDWDCLVGTAIRHWLARDKAAA